ncbi:uncharacterized protein K460DRAFT_293735 [Cucurbitaria berberidis CBS 394.84]|uniref:Uncharacterized protein n=1 Tax=Cucurbitaria berberidis CBS 394.84 TaxID=1168544 RepID=A0A9P4GA52_9PLEO|nr:uncharacterized protein K460DRAFT_293735 [Cucurbitaria berberidis CBS 394.84]KAF1841998.1 hypothetical protein K460DRAFT_293735 [Cucurbitaria berberidis CBS 394.84]
MTGTSGSGGLGESIRKGVGMVHGTGEAIRGTVLSTVDQASGDRASAVKNQEIANKGVDEWDRGYRGQPMSAGVTPVDADAARLNATQATSTNYGPHTTNTGNKLDPRFDSDLDHRGTVAGSTNVGPHSTNVGNKLDPRFDSDADHRANPASNVGGTGYTQHHPLSFSLTNFLAPFTCSAPSKQIDGAGEHENDHGPHSTHEHRGLISDTAELEPAQKLDPLYEVGGASMKDGGPHRTHVYRGSISGASGLEAAGKFDPPDDAAARGPGHSQPSPSDLQPKPTHQSNFSNKLDSDIVSDPSKILNRADTEPLPQDDDTMKAKEGFTCSSRSTH